MKERTENPNEEIVERTCKNCPLLPSKVGNKRIDQRVAAAADAASRLKKLVDGKLVNIVFSDPDDLSSKRVAAYFGYLDAENESEKNRLKEVKNENKPKPKFKPSDGF